MHGIGFPTRRLSVCENSSIYPLETRLYNIASTSAVNLVGVGIGSKHLIEGKHGARRILFFAHARRRALGQRRHWRLRSAR